LHISTPRVSSRFIFISDGKPLSSWQDGGQAEPHRVGWRIIAANNRPLGRSAAAFDSYAAALADAVGLKGAVDRLTSSLVHDQLLGHWTWRLLLDGAVVASCVHEYQRRVECSRALGQFLDALRIADPDTADVRHFGPNALRGYDTPPRINRQRMVALPLRPAT
jgi:hypothetical protein